MDALIPAKHLKPGYLVLYLRTMWTIGGVTPVTSPPDKLAVSLMPNPGDSDVVQMLLICNPAKRFAVITRQMKYTPTTNDA